MLITRLVTPLRLNMLQTLQLRISDQALEEKDRS
jgi:hypothetical protein